MASQSRPALPETKYRNIRLSDEDYQTWQDVAKAAGFPDRTTWLRATIRKEARRLSRTEDR